MVRRGEVYAVCAFNLRLRINDLRAQEDRTPDFKVLCGDCVASRQAIRHTLRGDTVELRSEVMK